MEVSNREREEEEEIITEEGVTEQPSVAEFDNEWVRFLSELNKDASMQDLVQYLIRANLTDRAKDKIRVYITTLLDREFAVSRITDRIDHRRLMDDKELIDADLPLGLTRFDITPEFHHLINLIRIKFGIKVRRSIGGFERRMIPTQITETLAEERNQAMEQQRSSHNIAEHVRNLFIR